MSATGRRKDSSVIEQLHARPYAYGFVQAVRLLECAAVRGDASAAAYHPVARHTPPATEVVRFHATQSLAFPAAEIDRLERKTRDSGAAQWHLDVNFMGLTGSSGVLPHHYTELVLKRLKLKDRTLANFCDLFNHRLVSLFYQASIKYRLPIEYTRAHHAGGESDANTRILLALIGLGTRGLGRRLVTPDHALLRYAGLLSHKIRTADGLRQMIVNLFALPVEIREFVGQWRELIDDVRTRLPSNALPRGQNNQLGKTTMLGRRGWLSQSKIQIVLGTLTKEQFDTLAPGTTTVKALDQVVRLYIDDEHDYEYIMRIRRRDIPRPMRLSKHGGATLAWDTWLTGAVPTALVHEETVEIPLSARRLI